MTTRRGRGSALPVYALEPLNVVNPTYVRGPAEPVYFVPGIDGNFIPVSMINLAFNELNNVALPSPGDGDTVIWDDASGKWVNTPSIVATLTIPTPLDVYIDIKARQAEQRVHGAFEPQLASSVALDSGTPINVTSGISKLVIVVNAGSDISGALTVTGTSVDRDTEDETASDPDVIVIDALTTDNSTTDSNGNAVHGFTGAYITSKWYKGAVAITTNNLTLTDVDVYQVSFEQFADREDVTVQILDITAECTNTAAWADIYLYSVMVTGSKCDVTNIADRHVSVADSESGKFYRLRRGDLGVALDGTTDGIWIDASLGPFNQNYWEAINIKVWYDVILPVSGNVAFIPDFVRRDGTLELTADWGVGDTYGLTEVPYITFNTSFGDGSAEGRLQWNVEDGTLEVGMPGGVVNLQIGQEMLIRCRNETGSTITNGSAVYITGVTGNRPLIDLADSTDPTKLAVAGLATEDIAHNSNGYVNRMGFVRDVNTLGMVEGRPIFLDESIPGAFTTTRPTAPNYIWILGLVIRAHATEGIIYSSPTPGHVVMSMSDVFTETPADGETLVWNIANLRFELRAHGDVNADSIRIRSFQSPASGGAGVAGEVAIDADYIYVCTAANTWKRVALTGGY